MVVEHFTIKDLLKQVKEGKTFRLFKPFFYKGQILLNVEKLLTEKDLIKLEDKVFGPLDVVGTVEHDTDDKIRKAVLANAVNVLKTSTVFKVDDTHHLDFNKRKECEKLLNGIINGNALLAHHLLNIYQFSKKLFFHTIHVGIISTIIDLGIQEKMKHQDGLRSEELLTAALLHDIGFLNLSKNLIEKKIFEYTPEEKSLYTTHPLLGKNRISADSSNFRSRVATIIYQHHERLTGDGFPEKKKKDIDELALIVGLSDEFHLLFSGELSSSQKTSSDIMSRFSRMYNIYGEHIVDAFFTWFRYLR